MSWWAGGVEGVEGVEGFRSGFRGGTPRFAFPLSVQLNFTANLPIRLTMRTAGFCTHNLAIYSGD